MNLTWLHLIFFIATIIIFLLILREATQSSLSAALLESRVHLDFFFKQIVSAWLNLSFFSCFLGTTEAFHESTRWLNLVLLQVQ